MAFAPTPDQIVVDVGGDALLRYGRLTRTLAPIARGGEEAKETHTRASVGTLGDRDGLLKSAGIDKPRLEWVKDSNGLFQPHLLLEAARTNVVLHNRDMTNAAWVKTTMTAAKDQTGPDGVANSASSLLATAANATCLQAITLASSARFQAARVKRLVGSGIVNMTMDGGTSWIVITPTTDWTRVTIPTQTLVDPNVGFRLVTLDDKIAVDFVQNENGTFQSSVIATTAAVTRSADSFSLPFPYKPQQMWVYDKSVERGTKNTTLGRIWQIGNANDTNPRLVLYRNADNSYQLFHAVGGSSVESTLATTHAFGDSIERLALFQSDGKIKLLLSVNEGADSAGPLSGALALGSSWSDAKFWLNSTAATQVGFIAFRRVVVGLNSLPSSIDEVRSFLSNSLKVAA